MKNWGKEKVNSANGSINTSTSSQKKNTVLVINHWIKHLFFRDSDVRHLFFFFFSEMVRVVYACPVKNAFPCKRTTFKLEFTAN